MDIAVVAEVYGGLPAQVVARAQEILRLAMAKKSMKIDMVTPLACLVAACRAMDEPIDHKRLALLIGGSARTLDQVARRIVNGINVKSQLKITPGSLCVRHGCAGITELVNRVHDEYQVIAERLSRGRGGGGGGARLFDPSEPVFAAACLVACAKRASLRVDRPKLLAEISANPRAFDAIVSSIESFCQQSLASASGGNKSTSRAARGAATSAAKSTSVGDSFGKQGQVMTKAAQRAAFVLERAVVDKAARDKAAKAADEAKAAAAHVLQKTATGGVTAQQYQAWRRKVLAARRKQIADNEEATTVPASEHQPSITVSTATDNTPGNTVSPGSATVPSLPPRGDGIEEVEERRAE